MKILIAMPCAYGRARIESTLSLAATVARLQKEGHEVLLMSNKSAPIDAARNDFAMQAQSLDTDYLLMVDDDMVWHPDDVVNLISNNVDVCVPLMHQKREPYIPVIYCRERSTDSRFPYVYKPILNLNKGLTRCDAVGMGMVLIKTNVLRKLPTPQFAKLDGVGEDIYFCNLAFAHVVDIYYDGRIEIGHLGDPLDVRTSWVINIPNIPITLEESNV